MSRVARLGLQGLAVAVVVGLLGLLVWRLAHQTDPPKGTAPNFTLPRLDRDGELELASLRGKAVVLNFWASWCGPCKDEAPLLEQLWRTWRGRGVVVLGVDAEDFRADARGFMRRFGMSYPVVHDGPGKIKKRYGLKGFPETFFVSRSGKIVAHIAGPFTHNDLVTIRRHIRRALQT